VYYTPTDSNYLAAVPADYSKYQADSGLVLGPTSEYVTIGGSNYLRVGYTSYSTSSEYFALYSSAYRPSGQNNVNFRGDLFLRHPYTNSYDAGFVLKTSHGEMFPYDYLNGYYSAALNISLPDVSGGYLIDRYMVGFYLPSSGGYRVLLAYGYNELIDLYEYIPGTHKIYDGAFYPVKYPYYLTNNRDGTLRLLRISTTNYNEIGEGVLILKFECPEFISSTTGFTSGHDGIETCKFLISDDDVVFWKWVAPNWVVESNPSLGNNIATFTAGCEAGFAPLNSKVVYIKVFLSSASKDNTPSLVRSSISLIVNYLSRSGKAVLCDDSRVSINFESPTSTKITSHDPGVYALAGVVTVFAPPIDTNLDV
jgi:hypothetical protein